MDEIEYTSTRSQFSDLDFEKSKELTLYQVNPYRSNFIMATYECAKCGMAVNAFCAKCETALDNDYITSDEGKKVQVSVCPNGHGKIKSPTCCGADMDCKG